MNNNNNRQSVNNYVYNRRRERSNDNPAPTPPPLSRNNSFDFTDRNTHSSESSSGMYNSYVSENDYNSYTSGYQSSNSYQNTYGSSYNNYSQSQQSNYSQPQQNNYSGYNQNDYGNYNQPQQNSYDNSPSNPFSTYQDYNSVDPETYSGRVVEVPLSKKMTKWDTIALLSFIIPFGLFMLLTIFSPSTYMENVIMGVIMTILFFLSFFGMIFGAIIAGRMKRKYLAEVCTVPVQGHLVGYEERRRHTKHHYYYEYAPKYQIFINNRYEIRTVDNFTRRQNWPATANLLVKPDGYEMIPADKSSIPSNGSSNGTIIAIIIILIGMFVVFPLMLSIISSLPPHMR